MVRMKAGETLTYSWRVEGGADGDAFYSDFHGATGDLRRFFADDPSAGAFMSGFFPVMMFGLPAACLAMYHTAKPEKKKAVGGMLFSLALTSFLTGVTEPIEFSFMFLAPMLYAVHAVLTGAAMALMNLLNVKLGFTFSAGLFDYVLNFGKATNPWLLIPVGLVYGAVYYGLFRFFIQRFNLKTPGREDEETVAIEAVATGGGRGADFLAALGGAGNLTSVDACTTRLRLIVVDQGAVNEPALKALGARGILGRWQEGEGQEVARLVMDRVLFEVGLALGIDHGRGGVRKAARRIGADGMALRLDEDRPAAAEAAEGAVEAARDGDELGLHGGIEIGSAEARAALERTVLVENHAGSDQSRPGQEIRKAGRGAAVFGEVHHGAPQTFR